MPKHTNSFCIAVCADAFKENASGDLLESTGHTIWGLEQDQKSSSESCFKLGVELPESHQPKDSLLHLYIPQLRPDPN